MNELKVLLGGWTGTCLRGGPQCCLDKMNIQYLKLDEAKAPYYLGLTMPHLEAVDAVLSFQNIYILDGILHFCVFIKLD